MAGAEGLRETNKRNTNGGKNVNLEMIFTDFPVLESEHLVLKRSKRLTYKLYFQSITMTKYLNTAASFRNIT